MMAHFLQLLRFSLLLPFESSVIMGLTVGLLSSSYLEFLEHLHSYSSSSLGHFQLLFLQIYSVSSLCLLRVPQYIYRAAYWCLTDLTGPTGPLGSVDFSSVFFLSILQT